MHDSSNEINTSRNLNHDLENTTNQTIVDILIQRAKDTPDQIAYTFLQNGAEQGLELTYSELFHGAATLAARLQQRGLEGERILLVFKSNYLFVVAFFACLLTGSVAVPKRNHLAKRLKLLVDDADARAAIIDSDEVMEAGTIGQEAVFFWFDIRTIDLQQSMLSQVQQWKKPTLSADSLAFLQYTSGSTGDPKGVMVSHGNIIANSFIIKKAFGHSEQSVVLVALPLFHDMGLIGGVLQPLYAGFHMYLMSPVQLIQEPQRWLQLISELRITTAGGPNFMYELASQLAKPEHFEGLDLSSWNVAFCGAEPIRPKTVERFNAVFGPHGFRAESFFPCYGLAESTLFVTGNPLQQVPRMDLYVDPQQPQMPARSVISCGIAGHETQVIIVDPETNKPLTDGEQGEIWVSGKSVAQGYWRRPEVSAHTFGARIEGNTLNRPFLRTGDLGYMKQNELYVSGRLKDLVILHGQNYAPQDLEVEAENSHSDIRSACVAAFTVPRREQERLVLAVELKRTAMRRTELWPDIMYSVRRAILHAYQIEVDDVVLLKTGTLPKTSSGKVQRRLCRDAYLANELERVAPVVKVEASVTPSLLPQQPKAERRGSSSDKHHALARHVKETLAQVLAIDVQQVDLEQGFFDLGMDSLMAVKFRDKLEKDLGIELPATLMLDCPTGSALIAYLDDHALHLNINKPSAQQTITPTLAEPLAIVGMSCRFPKANNIQEFWGLLARGENAIGPIPEGRWDMNKYYDPDPDAPGKMYVKQGGFIDQIDQFDADFFGISPREASYLDPQQRLLLEQTWLALEDAGIDLPELRRCVTSVFVGISGSDYAQQLLHQSATQINAYIGTGNSASTASGRLSYFLGLEGTTASIDTACSSSLSALHFAAENLNQKESQIAIVAGVNVILSPEITINCCKAHMLAPDGQCKTFDDSADGYVRSEGCGVVIVKRLSDALAAGDTIHAVIRGTAINHDGHTSGLTVPNGLKQQMVIRHALENAGLNPSDIDYVEVHGTGTPLGDPIELRALTDVFKDSHNKQSPLQIGSVKTNIGHLEAAAGMAGLIKVILGLKYQQIPAHLNFNHPNHHVDWEKLPISIPTATQEWVTTRGKRRAGVSSFGFSGTNAHIIVEEAPAIQSQAHIEYPHEAPQVIILSARNDQALKELTQSYESLLQKQLENWLDIDYATQTRRHHFEHRLAFVSENAGHAQRVLHEFIATGSSPELFLGKKNSSASPTIAMLFTGQGSQYLGMGHALYKNEPVFKNIIDRCDVIFQRIHKGAPTLTEALYSDQTQLINQTAYTQPALFATEMALYCLWSSWGIHPHALLGHSVGEFAAACAARIFNIEDGMTLVTHRGRLMQALPTTGKMAVVLANKDMVETLVAPYSTTVSVAAYNGMSNTVISGLGSDVDQICALAQRGGLTTKPLAVSHAFHSPLMRTMIDEFKAIAASINYHEAQYILISNLTGKPITSMSKEQWADYWSEHVLAPVQFHQGMQVLHQHGCTTFLEVGPAPVLTAMGKSCIEVDEQQQTWLTSLQPKSEDEQTILTTLAQLYTMGIDVDWKRVNPYRPSKHVALPAYPFQRQRYWFEQSAVEPGVHTSLAPAYPNANQHPLLGQPLLLLGSKEIRYQHILHQDQPAYLKDQTSYQQKTVPESAILSMVWEAARRLPLKPENLCLHNISLVQPLLLPEAGQFIQLIIHPQQEAGYTFSVVSMPASQLNESHQGDELGIVCATGDIIESAGQSNVTSQQLVNLQAFQQDGHQPVTIAGFYQEMRRRGIEQSADSAFKVVRAIWVQADTTVLGHLALTEKMKSEAEQYQIHPTLLEGALQTLLVLLSKKHTNDVLRPVAFKKMWFSQPLGHDLWILARNFSLKQNEVHVDMQFLDNEGRLVGEISELELQVVNTVHLAKDRLPIIRDWLYQIAWQRQEILNTDVDRANKQSRDYWLVLSSADNKELQRQFELANQRCIAQRIKPTVAGYPGGAQPSVYSVFETLFNSLDQHALCKGILYLADLEVNPADMSGENFQAAQQDICSEVLALVQTVTRHSNFKHAPLMLVTRGSQSLTEQESPNLAYTSLWGLAGVIANEFPELRCTRLDLDPSKPDSYADLINELNVFDIKNVSYESQIAYRKGERYLARLQHVEPPQQIDQPQPLVNDASSYLITGGLGALGLVIAEWFIQQGAQHLVLTSRHEPNEHALLTIERLGRNGAQIQCVLADVACTGDVHRLVGVIEQTMPPLKGIIHAAGVLKDGLLEQQQRDYFDEVMAPKVAGAWNIHQATQTMSLDFFIHFSSVATVFGATGQGNYAAANAFLDGLSHYRRAHGLACQSINWGPWAENGMANNLQARFRQLGMIALSNREGLEAMESIMLSKNTQTSVMPINWDVFYEAVNGDTVPLMLRDIWCNGQVASQVSKPPQERDFLQQLQTAPIEQRHPLTMAQIAVQFAKVVGLNSKDIDVQREFSQFGLDSLMVLELRNRLNKTLSCSIPMSAFLDYPTVEQLAKFILTLVGISNAKTDDLTDFQDLNRYPSDQINNVAQLKWHHEGEL